VRFRAFIQKCGSCIGSEFPQYFRCGPKPKRLGNNFSLFFQHSQIVYLSIAGECIDYFYEYELNIVG